jgi:hypothetical protein
MAAIGASLSKKRYQEIVRVFESNFDDKVKADEVLLQICSIMNFDPTKSAYNQEVKEKILARRHKMRDEQGISTYISSGAKKFYEKKTGAGVCHNYLCESTGYEKYKGYCIRCVVHMFPDERIVKSYKTKERHVADFIRATFPDVNIVLDKSVEGGCSRYRPDVLIDMLTHTIIIEVDENQHDAYDCTCENKRMMQLFTDLGERPLVMIRFNPDDYIDSKACKAESCFTYDNKLGLPKVSCNKRWDTRLKVLESTLANHMETVPGSEVTVEHLFYDGFHWCD